MRFVCSRTSIANSIFSLILETPDFVVTRCGSLIKADVIAIRGYFALAGLVRQDSPCIVVYEQRHVSSARTHVHSGLVSQVSWHGHSGIDRMRGACYVAILWRIMFPDTRLNRVRFRVEIELKFFAVQKGS